MTGQYQRICIVFLDSDLTIHGKISADTGDAQACVQPPSRENGRLDILNSCWIPPIFGGSLIQASPPDAIFSYSRDPLRVKAADGAGVAVNFLHTAKTAVKFHVSLLFQWPDAWLRVPGDDHYNKIISSLDDVVYCLFDNFIIASLRNLRLRGVRQF